MTRKCLALLRWLLRANLQQIIAFSQIRIKVKVFHLGNFRYSNVSAFCNCWIYRRRNRRQNFFQTQRSLLWATGSTGQSNFSNKLSFKCFSSAEAVQIKFFLFLFCLETRQFLFLFWWIYSFLSLASQQLEVADSKGAHLSKPVEKQWDYNPSLCRYKMDPGSL